MIYHESYLFVIFLFVICLFHFAQQIRYCMKPEYNYPSIPTPFLVHHSWNEGKRIRTQHATNNGFLQADSLQPAPFELYSHQISIQLRAHSSFQ